MDGPCQWSLTLVDGWQLSCNGRPVTVALRQQRVIAAIALHKSIHRTTLAGLLWPESSELKAAGNLRESIWVISHRLPELLVDGNDPLELRSTVRVDTREIREQISRLDESSSPALEADLLQELRGPGLLPGWYEDWAVAEQERWEQLRLNVLERLARTCLQRGDIDGALDAAGAAVAIDPLRESAHRLRIETHMADGNLASALHVYQDFRRRLWEEVGVAPSEKIAALVQPILTREEHRTQANAHTRATPRKRALRQRTLPEDPRR
ncbi:AfsR/SARP family transcriptional regulator [Arthrobacter sp. 92]|uniref:AfsR/SARP family transcriptional regulator n=1 Tax=Arthrobacter sp. 92 TaxID=3418175 RepID=UPI003CFE36AA